LCEARGGEKCQLPIDVLKDGIEERGAGVVEHVDVPDAVGKGVDGKRVVVVVGLVVDGHPVMEGG
jgi:hypothetical protein